jgi:hypothetical protein
MSCVGLEPTIPMLKQQNTVYAFDSAKTGVDIPFVGYVMTLSIDQTI